jgi:hypothetical protein
VPACLGYTGFNHCQIKWDGCKDSQSNVIVHENSHWHLSTFVTAALMATPSSDLNTQVESYRDEQEVLRGFCCFATLAGSLRDRRKEAEIHKRLRMWNTGEKCSLLIPVRARVGKRIENEAENPTDVSMTKP